MSTNTVERGASAPGRRPRTTPRSMAIWTVVAVVGAVCWAVVRDNGGLLTRGIRVHGWSLPRGCCHPASVV